MRISVTGGAGFIGSAVCRHLIEETDAYVVNTLEKRQGLRIACPEEIAYSQGLITHDEFLTLGKKLEKSAYGQYLLKTANERA